MPLERISSTKALEVLKDNPFGSWPNRADPDSRVWPAAKPGYTPAFRLEPGEPVFTIGSCFARNIEKSLLARGFDVPANRIMRSSPELQKVGAGALNNFSVPSIYNELAWALDPEVVYDEAANFAEVVPGKFADLHLLTQLRPVPLEEAKARRAALREIYSQVVHARVAIITLGLTEVWFDTRTGCYTNGPPPRSITRAVPERFELHVLSFEETMGFLRKTFELLRRHCRPDFRILLTVSPVPLVATYRPMDVMTANTYSKATLRVAAETAAAEYDFVTYLPVYESVTLSERTFAWQEDETHVTDQIVELNVSRMLAAYAPAIDDLTVEDLRREVEENARRPAKVFARLKERPDLWTDRQLAWALTTAAVQIGRLDMVEQTRPHLAGSGRDRLMVLDAVMAESRGDWRGVLEILTDEPKGPRMVAEWYRLRLLANAELGDLDRAAAVALDWGRARPFSGEPQRLMALAYAKAGNDAAADASFQEAMGRSDAPAIAMQYADHLRRTGRSREAAALLDGVQAATPVDRARLASMQNENALFGDTSA